MDHATISFYVVSDLNKTIWVLYSAHIVDPPTNRQKWKYTCTDVCRDIYYLGHITLKSQDGVYFTEKHDLLNDKSVEVSRIHPLGAMFLCTTSLGNPSKKLSRYFLTRKTKTSNRHSGSHLSSHYHLIAAQLCRDFCSDPSHIKWNNSVWEKHPWQLTNSDLSLIFAVLRNIMQRQVSIQKQLLLPTRISKRLFLGVLFCFFPFTGPIFFSIFRSFFRVSCGASSHPCF